MSTAGHVLMTDEVLTPIERSALFVLMAENRPLRESADLESRHGVALTAAHRKKLQRLGLISTTSKPYTHTLTKKGWAWVEREAGSPRPAGQMNMGALYAVMAALSEQAKRSGVPLAKLFDPDARIDGGSATSSEERSGSTGNGAIAQAAWSEADESLALALQDMAKLDRALERLRSDVGEKHAKAVKRAEGAVKLVTQWVRQAARQRLVSVTAASGDEISFDPVHYVSDDAVPEGARVRVRKPSVVRGDGPASVVVARGEVDIVP